MPTKIEWTDEVLEVTGGCTKCSVGCEHCWAIKEVWRMAHNPRLGDKWKGLVEKKNGVLNWTGGIKLFEDAREIPLKRKKPTTYFIVSKADLFHPKVPFEFIDKVISIIALCPQHTFQVLTKRPEIMCRYFGKDYQRTRSDNINKLMQIIKRSPYYFIQDCCKGSMTLPNLWLGVTVEHPDYKNRADILRQIPAAKRFISFEPLLADMGEVNLEGIDWVIIGCESGPHRRPCKLEWVRNLVRQGQAAGAAVFVKQLNINGRVSHSMAEWPVDLRVREYPLKDKQ